jgi:hypothetical protein
MKGRKEQVLAALTAAVPPGLTTDEIVAATGIVRHSASGRLSEMAAAGLIKKSGIRRTSKMDRRVTVWVLNNDETPSITAPPNKMPPVIEKRPQLFWASIRQQIAAFVTKQGKNVDTGSRIKYLKELESDIKAAVEHFTTRMYNAKAPPAAPISRRKVLDACEALRVPPPAIGKPADLKVAKKNKRHASRLYHPDVTGHENETTRALFEAAIEAYTVLELYNQTTQENTNGQ